jgi:hypothetical protein
MLGEGDRGSGRFRGETSGGRCPTIECSSPPPSRVSVSPEENRALRSLWQASAEQTQASQPRISDDIIQSLAHNLQQSFFRESDAILLMPHPQDLKNFNMQSTSPFSNLQASNSDAIVIVPQEGSLPQRGPSSWLSLRPSQIEAPGEDVPLSQSVDLGSDVVDGMQTEEAPGF